MLCDIFPRFVSSMTSQSYCNCPRVKIALGTSLTMAETKEILTSFSNITTTTGAPPLFRILKASIIVFSAPTQSMTTSTPFPVILVTCSRISGA
jgi:hypothetical protein